MGLALSPNAGFSVRTQGIWNSGKCQTADDSVQQDWDNLPADYLVHDSSIKLKKRNPPTCALEFRSSSERGFSDHVLAAEGWPGQCPSCGRRKSASLDSWLAIIGITSSCPPQSLRCQFDGEGHFGFWLKCENT